MYFNLFKISAILGLLCIIIGITLIKPRQKREQYIFFIVGGILLEIYSIHIRDTIFIILQLAFTLSALFELSMLYKRARALEKSIKEYLIDLEKHIIRFHKRWIVQIWNWIWIISGFYKRNCRKAKEIIFKSLFNDFWFIKNTSWLQKALVSFFFGVKKFKSTKLGGGRKKLFASFS